MLRYTFEKIGLILFEKNFFLFFSMKRNSTRRICVVRIVGTKFREASDLIQGVLDRGDSKRNGKDSGGFAPLSLNLLPPNNARGLLNLARIPRIGSVLPGPPRIYFLLQHSDLSRSTLRSVHTFIYYYINFLTVK